MLFSICKIKLPKKTLTVYQVSHERYSNSTTQSKECEKLLVYITSPIKRENDYRDLLIFHLEEKDNVMTLNTSISQNLVSQIQ